VQANVERVMEGKRRSGKLFTEELRRMRAYRNPDFLQKMVEFFGIEDQGTCFPKEIFDPSSLPKEDNYKACVLNPYLQYRGRLATLQMHQCRFGAQM
jgi:hypothetical protein